MLQPIQYTVCATGMSDNALHVLTVTWTAYDFMFVAVMLTIYET